MLNQDQALSMFDRLIDAQLDVSIRHRVESFEARDVAVGEVIFEVEVRISSLDQPSYLRLIADLAQKHGATLHPSIGEIILR